MTQIVIGTERGLFQLSPQEPLPLGPFAEHEITAVARDRARWWVLVEGRSLWRSGADGTWEEITSVAMDGIAATCLGTSPVGLLVGTESAHLLRLDGATLVRVDSFEDVAGREAWYTPWGDPPDVRSISTSVDGAMYVNVHVGGVVRSTDGGRSWTPTLDVEADVHQVLAHPSRPALVLAAAAVGLVVSRDGGESWEIDAEGLHATYARAVTVAGDAAIVSVSTGPGGRRAALYRRPLAGAAGLTRCGPGLPEWFRGNIDTACVASVGSTVAFGSPDGCVYLSTDAGERWERVARGLPAIAAVTAA